jgi:tetratricopeptide (TPR) repeat protein
VLVVLLLVGKAGAAPPERRAAPADEADAKARAHFKRAGEHFVKEDWRAALDEYREVLALTKNRAAMRAAAICLRQLEQYDEALEMYEELHRLFPVLPPELEAKVAPAMEELLGKVGTVALRGDVPAEASILVDDRLRGTLPLRKPLRVGMGSHRVRVVKEGFEPIEANVKVEGGKEAVVDLQATSRSGRLRVIEKHNRVLDVELDGTVVGRTPWEGLVPAGDHDVRLHGFVRLDAEDVEEASAPPRQAPEAALDRTEMASERSPVTVRLYERSDVAMSARDLDASLRIEASPAAAAVAIDGKVVGYGAWQGRLPLGDHTVEITASGFLPSRQDLRLERRKQREIRVVLALVPKLGRLGTWGPRRNAAVGAFYTIGAAGITLSAITGAAALVTIAGVRPACRYPFCPVSEQPAANRASALATASTVGLVAGALGLVTGTVFVLWVRLDEPRPPPEARPRAHVVTWSAGLGPGSFDLEGRF